MTQDELNEKMSKAIALWAKRNNISPSHFRDVMGWSYPYSWRILRGYDPFVPAAWGRFILGFGLNTLLDLFTIAKVDLNK